MDKAAFQALSLAHDDPLTGLVVRSGGSSGQVAYSTFRWADYHEQMAVTAHGLVAAGLEPARDRVMNLFAAGYLYGSFISFWTILEHLRVRQYPMAMVPEQQVQAQLASGSLCELLPAQVLDVPLYWHHWRNGGELLSELTRQLQRSVGQWLVQPE